MDFSLILFVATLIFGALWLLDKLILAPGRARKYKEAVAAAGANASGTASNAVQAPRMPVIIEYARALFPVIALVFVLRSFIVEPFRIPSGSMLPTLEIGDFILVNKFKYGLRLPVVNKKVVSLSLPERGDVIVFRFPVDPKINFIKRVVGVPGDRIVYDKKRLFINDQPVNYETGEPYAQTESGAKKVQTDRFIESLGDHQHEIAVDKGPGGRRETFTVPADSYFVMGDNRDRSNDSRFWGFVPEENVVGEAFFIWFSVNSGDDSGVDWARIGDSIK